MPLLSLSEVAQRTGMARSSIYRLIDEGKLSATLDHRGRKCVELTEMLRVFGAIQNETGQEDNKQDTSNSSVRTARTSNETGQETITALMQELAQARAELQFRSKELDLKDRELGLMQTRVNELKATHEQAITEKNRFLEIIERQSLLLAAPKPARPSAPRVKTVTPPAAKRTSTSSTAATKSKPVAIKKSTAVKPKAAPAVAVKPKTTPPPAKPKAAAKTTAKAKPAAKTTRKR